MDTTRILRLLLALVGLTLGAACGDDDGATTTGDGDGDTEATDWELEFPRNLDCPENVPPLDGEGAPHGACCFRGKPNSVRLAEQTADSEDTATGTVGYRMNSQGPGNLFATLGALPLPDLAIARADNHEQILLIENEGPREKNEDGVWVSASGEGKTTLGGGVYNCDGTYSFYGKGAAPPFGDTYTYPGADDPDRWEARTTKITIDATKEDQGRISIAFEDNFRGYSYTSFIESGTDPYEIDWEIVTEGFTMIEFPYDESDPNCAGERVGNLWVDAGSFAVYAELRFNNDPENTITPLGGQNFCQLVSFGPLGAQEDIDTLNCETTPRCMPDSADCMWKALPDSLCPETEAEQDIFACHVGDDNNVDNFETNCMATAPTEHSDATDGQCCSPLGDSDTLPACNAFRIVSNFVAASAVITEERSSKLINFCPMEP